MELVKNETDPRVIDPVVARMGCICPDCDLPIAVGSLVVPREMNDDDGEEWIGLAHVDCDDVIRGKA
tara:strand:- start:2967 stop:3167 length:201 start_codon:yes stop_codon:yes gene_type:complete